MPRPIVLAGRTSNTAKRLVSELVASGADAYYQPAEVPRGALVVRWAMGGDKLVELRRLAAAGILTPKFSLEPMPGWLARQNYHQEGKDFIAPVSDPGFWTEPLYTDHEFRVHVIHDLGFRIQHKYLPDGVRPVVVQGVPIRNHSLGWRFNPRPEFPAPVLTRVLDTAKAAVRALALDHGAVDVGLILPDQPVVFEVNTRPSMDEYTRRAYVTALRQLAGY